jgi:A/G-specific adenine glycosylase
LTSSSLPLQIADSETSSEANPFAGRAFSEKLIHWYQTQHRPLPWRETQDPYRIWLSEVMLQQTQVITVIPYYERFLQRYPSVQALANAPLDDVLKQWEGLGYYSRCRNLHKAAQQIVSEHQGIFPDTFEAVRGLPGIGDYTAGAICTFAFRQPTPILDGNIKRVYARLTNEAGSITETSVLKRFWGYSKQLVAVAPDAYALNQGLMELGATVCTPQSPLCLLCPVQAFCQGRLAGRAESLPYKPKKAPVPHKAIGVAVLWNEQGQLFIQKRPEEGLLAGLWEFPGGKQEADETLDACVHREIQEELGVSIVLGQALKPVTHAYSHFKVTLYAYHAKLSAESDASEIRLKAAQDHRWVDLNELEQFAFPTANKKLIAQL